MQIFARYTCAIHTRRVHWRARDACKLPNEIERSEITEAQMSKDIARISRKVIVPLLFPKKLLFFLPLLGSFDLSEISVGADKYTSYAIAD